MSLSICIPELIEQGNLTGQRAVRAKQVYQQLLNRYDHEMGDAAARSRATAETIKALEREVAYKKRVVAQQVKAQSDWLAKMEKAAGGAGKSLDPVLARHMLESLDKKTDAVRNGFLEGFGEFLLKHRRNIVGEVRHRDDLTLTLREKFGEATGDLNAKELAQGMDATMEAMRVRRNAAGGQTSKLDQYIFPQRHESRLIRALAPTMDAAWTIWRALPSIENARIRDLELQNWATGARREDILRQAFESIWTDGANKAKPGVNGVGSMANQRADARVIHFANADDWMAYTERFGGSDNIYDIFVGHVSAMAREIVLMEELGPNPAATIRFQKDTIAKSLGQHGTQKQIDRMPKYERDLQDTFDQLTGAAMQPTDRGVAVGFSAYRAFKVATKLGSAVLKSAPDFYLFAKTARMNRLGVFRSLAEYVKLWSPADFKPGSEAAVANARLNAKLRLITDDWLALSSASYRYTGQELTGEVSRRIADGVIRASGLSRHTRNGLMALGRQYWANLTEWRGRAFAQLDPAVQRQFTRYGISVGDWDSFRASPLATERGQEWLFPGSVADRRVADRFTSMVIAETEMGMIVPHIRTRTIMAKAGQPGSFWGEVGRSVTLFKSFPLDIIVRHGGFTMERAGAGGTRAAYAIALLPGLIAAGGLSNILGDLVNLRDPESMFSKTWWAKAAAASGAGGPLGDALFNQGRNYEMSVLQYLLGPLIGDDLVGTANDIRDNIIKEFDDDPETESTWLMDAFDKVQKEIPGNNLWYLRQAYQRLIVDSVRRMVDEEEAGTVFDRRGRNAAASGAPYFWAPGDSFTDARAPDWGNLFADNDDGDMPNGW